jgi:hypothetical protein
VATLAARVRPSEGDVREICPMHKKRCRGQSNFGSLGRRE